MLLKINEYDTIALPKRLVQKALFYPDLQRRSFVPQARQNTSSSPAC